MTDTERKLGFIAARVQLARQRHARLLSIRNLDIEDYVLLDGGCVTRLKSRHIVFSVNGVKVQAFTGKWGNIVSKMLSYLDTRLAENKEAA
jgi:hypothetical protein